MTDVLLLYGTTHGQTGRIAARIAEQLRRAGARVTLRDICASGDPDPATFGAVVVGAPVHMGRHRREVVEWARRHARALNARPSAFFSVCLSVLDDPGPAQDYIDTFVDDTGWWPRTTTTFAGALRYVDYDRRTRLMLRLLMARGGHCTDTRRNHEYTDWDAVDAFAERLAVRLPRVGAVAR